MVKQANAPADSDHAAQSNDGGEYTNQQIGEPSIKGGPEPTNDQSQNRRQTDAQLKSQQERIDPSTDAGVVVPAGSETGDQYYNPDNPPVETRPVEKTAPNEETPGYEPAAQE